MNKRHLLSILIAAVTLLTASPVAEAGDFWDFLKDGWEEFQRRFEDSEESAAELETEIVASAESAGTPVVDPDQYNNYAAKLAKTLSQLTPEQQARVFGPD